MASRRPNANWRAPVSMRRRSPRTDNPRRHTRTGKTAATAGTNGRRKMATDAEALPAGGEQNQNEALVITAPSLGTVFEWDVSDERRVGKEYVSTCSTGWSTDT